MSNSVGDQKALVANKHIFPTKAFWFPTESFKKAIWPGFGPKLPFPLLILQFFLFQNLPFEASFSFLLALWAFSLPTPFGSLLNLTMSNSVGSQKALVAKGKCNHNHNHNTFIHETLKQCQKCNKQWFCRSVGKAA